jgi:hypothetical protein
MVIQPRQELAGMLLLGLDQEVAYCKQVRPLELVNVRCNVIEGAVISASHGIAPVGGVMARDRLPVGLDLGHDYLPLASSNKSVLA